MHFTNESSTAAEVSLVGWDFSLVLFAVFTALRHCKTYTGFSVFTFFVKNIEFVL